LNRHSHKPPHRSVTCFFGSGSYRFQQTSINIYVQMLISMWLLNRQHFMCSHHTYTIRQFWWLHCRVQ
jgi:hypothetical protein